MIRVNSQSGKSGVSYLLQTDYGLDLPRALQPEFSQVVQRMTDDSAREATSSDLWELYTSVLTASVRAVLAAVNRASRRRAAPPLSLATDPTGSAASAPHRRARLADRP